ncbi:uncharacterized protein LOC143555853 [Bidens hawaiensis]|uniref:uncharacterized protein LOC143555853 n=1 Tax=Bidens hawaiensis TaxID=980011 RepID=UPI0040497EAC
MSGRRRKSESLWDSKESQNETKEFNSNDNSPKRSNSDINDVLMSDDFSTQGNENMLMDNDNINDKHRMMADRAFDDWEGQYGQPNRGGSRAVGGRERARSGSPHRTRNRDQVWDQDQDRTQPWDQDRDRDRGRTTGLARSRSRSRSRSRGREQGRATSPSRGGSNRFNNRPDYSGGSQHNRTNKGGYNDQDNRRQSNQDIKRPCKFFIMGRCNRDDDCRFSHDVSKSEVYDGRSQDHDDYQETRFIPDNNSGNINMNGNGTNHKLNGSVDEKGKHLAASRNDIPQASSLPQVSQNLDFAALGLLYSTVVNEPVKASAPMESQKSKEPEPVGKVEASENKVAEKSKMNVGKSEVDESNMGNDEKATRAFKVSLVEFVKEILKPTWKEGKMSRDVYKTIVKKVVEKVMGTIEGVNIPRTQEKTDLYLAFSKSKITKLVEAYVGRLAKG